MVGVDVADHLGQGRSLAAGAGPGGDLAGRVGVRPLEVVQAVQAVVGQQPLAVQAPEPPGRLGRRQPLADHHIAERVGDPQPGRAGAMDDHPLVGHTGAVGPGRGERRREHHRGRALHVVVEGQAPVGVTVKDAPGVGRPQVLPVQQGVGEQLGRGRDVGVEELVVARPADPRVPVAQVHLVVEQPQVVGADVQDHRDHPAGVDPGGGDIDGQLADGDLDAADAPVPDAEDPLGVGGHDQVDVAGLEAVVAERRLDQVGVVDRQEHPAGTAVLVAVALDRLADGRGVDDRQHVAQVLREQAVEQDLVAVAEVGQVHVPGQLLGLPEVLGVDPADLPLDGRDPMGQQPDQAEGPPLLGCERGPPVEHRRPQHREPAGPDPHHRPLRRPCELVRPLGHGASSGFGHAR
jgi:hypothetical protein